MKSGADVYYAGQHARASLAGRDPDPEIVSVPRILPMKTHDPFEPGTSPGTRVPGRLSRRRVLRGAVGAAFGAGGAWSSLGAMGRTRAEAAELIVRNSRPLDLETPVEALDSWLTPNSQFFVRSHLGVPAVGLGPWRLELHGLVEKPASLALEDLEAMEQVTIPAVLQCSGNGRAFFRPTVPGVVWERGAVGQAEWTGVRLFDLLDRAGIGAGAAHVHFLGADAPPSPRTPAFLRSLPIARALDRGTLVASRMNGEALPLLHGGPIRLVVPGWSGNHWMKWLRSIAVARDEAPGFYMQSGYRMPKVPVPPGTVPKPTDLVPVTTLNVKSLITRPLEGDVVRAGRVEVRGVAWTGEGHVVRVEVSTGPDAPWTVAELQGEGPEGSWRRWHLACDVPTPGKLTLRARASDSKGRTQPEVTPWNRSGYLWNGIDRVTCEVG